MALVSGIPSGQMVTVVRRTDNTIAFENMIGRIGRVLCVNRPHDHGATDEDPLLIVVFEDGYSDVFWTEELLACDPQFNFSDGEALSWLLGVARNADIYRGGEPSAEIVVERWMMRTGIHRQLETERSDCWPTGAARSANAHQYGVLGTGKVPKSFPVLRTLSADERDAFISWLVALVREADSLIFAGVETGLLRLLDDERHLIRMLDRRAG